MARRGFFESRYSACPTPPSGVQISGSGIKWGFRSVLDFLVECFRCYVSPIRPWNCSPVCLQKKSFYPLTAQRLALLKDIHKNQHSSCPVIKDDMECISLFVWKNGMMNWATTRRKIGKGMSKNFEQLLNGYWALIEQLLNNYWTLHQKLSDIFFRVPVSSDTRAFHQTESLSF